VAVRTVLPIRMTVRTLLHFGQQNSFGCCSVQLLLFVPTCVRTVISIILSVRVFCLFLCVSEQFYMFISVGTLKSVPVSVITVLSVSLSVRTVFFCSSVCPNTYVFSCVCYKNVSVPLSVRIVSLFLRLSE
jgi:hypothetical protein